MPSDCLALQEAINCSNVHDRGLITSPCFHSAKSERTMHYTVQFSIWRYCVEALCSSKRTTKPHEVWSPKHSAQSTVRSLVCRMTTYKTRSPVSNWSPCTPQALSKNRTSLRRHSHVSYFGINAMPSVWRTLWPLASDDTGKGECYRQTKHIRVSRSVLTARTRVSVTVISI